MLHLLRRLRQDERGIAALEYGLILCLIVVVMVVGLTSLGHANSGQWTYVASQIASGTAQANS